VVVFHSIIPLFETAADNLGFICSRGQFILEVQADIEMCELGYNEQLMKPFNAFHDIIGVSGRSCHGITYPEGCGKMYSAAHDSSHELLDRAFFYIGETCNRGPLLLHKERVAKLGYLDEVNYFLDNSEHDLFTRARIQKNWYCGYIPIHYLSPIEDGSTRKPRDPINDAAYIYKKTTCPHNGFVHQWIQLKPESFPLQEVRLPIDPTTSDTVELACEPETSS
jgi:hypothetical protein